jgi:hypothetical protein
MNVRTFLTVAASALVGLCLALMLSSTSGAAQDSTKPREVQWEYRYYHANESQAGLAFDRKALNKVGAEGWELCGVRSLPSGAVFYLKRPKPDAVIPPQS